MNKTHPTNLSFMNTRLLVPVPSKRYKNGTRTVTWKSDCVNQRRKLILAELRAEGSSDFGGSFVLAKEKPTIELVCSPSPRCGAVTR